VTASTAGRRYRSSGEGLEAVPAELLEFVTGWCVRCARAMARKLDRRDCPALRPCTVERGLADGPLCRACNRADMRRPVEHGESASGAQIVRARGPVADVAALLALIACLGCRRVPGIGGVTRHADGCPVARNREE
jgi:hypothetical protein